MTAVVEPALGDDPGPAGVGLIRALQQFHLIPPEADLSRYRVVIVPETTRIDNELAARLRAFTAAGGALVVVGEALADEDGRPVLPELGIEVSGPSPYTATFLRSLAGGQDTGGMDAVMYQRGLRLRPTGTATALYGVVEPYFQRAYDRFSGHEYTPPDRLSDWAAVVHNGRTVSIAVPLLEMFGRYGNEQYRLLLGEVLDTLLPDPAVRADGPAHLETTVVRTPTSTVVHLLSVLPSRQADGLDLVHDPFPLVDVTVAVRTDRAPSRVRLQPDGQDLDWQFADGYSSARVTVLNGHAMLVLDD